MFLYQILIGATPTGRNTEQHDTFFGIANNLTDILPQLKTFWPEAADKMHIDGFRKCTAVQNYKIEIVAKTTTNNNNLQLFFINLGGYKPNEFCEFHYPMLVVATNKSDAIAQAKQTAFYKHTGFEKAPSHIDDKYGIDVDDIHAIQDILHPNLKQQFSIAITPNTNNAIVDDELYLGYYTIQKIEKGIIEPS
jgi:hypothetical protein